MERQLQRVAKFMARPRTHRTPTPPPAMCRKPPRSHLSLLPTGKYKFLDRMSNVGLGSSIGIMDGNTGLSYIGGTPFRFLPEATPPYPTSPNFEMGPP